MHTNFTLTTSTCNLLQKRQRVYVSKISFSCSTSRVQSNLSVHLVKWTQKQHIMWRISCQLIWLQLFQTKRRLKPRWHLTKPSRYFHQTTLSVLFLNCYWYQTIQDDWCVTHRHTYVMFFLWVEALLHNTTHSDVYLWWLVISEKELCQL